MDFKKTLVNLVLVGAMTFGLAGKANASNLNPPSWRGQPLSLQAVWEFNEKPEDQRDVRPKTFDNSHGGGFELYKTFYSLPKAKFFPEYFEWKDDGKGHKGMYSKGDIISLVFFEMPNYIDDKELKKFRIQMDYYPNGSWPVKVSEIDIYDPKLSSGVSITAAKQTGKDSGKYPAWEDWEASPNPDHEEIAIEMMKGYYLFEVVIDTISIPEPSSIVLLGSALAGFLAFRKRFKQK